MKANKIIARALVVLGFGGAAALSGGCGASRAQKSRQQENAPAVDSVIVRDGDVPVQVMYGVLPARFDPGKPIPNRTQ